MRKKNRNNALRMKRSLQKTLQKTGEALKATEKRRLEAQKLKEEHELKDQNEQGLEKDLASKLETFEIKQTKKN